MATLKRDRAANYVCRFRFDARNGRGSAREWETNLTNPTRRVNATAPGSPPRARAATASPGRRKRPGKSSASVIWTGDTRGSSVWTNTERPSCP
jgi:hypothetical protein